MANVKYTKEHVDYLRKIVPGRYADEITKMFNEKFNMNVNKETIHYLKAKYKIKSNVQTLKPKYTKEHIDYLRKLCDEGLFNKEITKKFNEKFNTNKSEKAIKTIRNRHGLKTAARNQFPKGHTPWNKGKKGSCPKGCEKTWFKKGMVPSNYRPIGSERTIRDGYMEIKVADPNVWQSKHVFVWEQHNGAVPENHCIIFGDGNKRNFNIDNLICVSRQQLVRLNQYGLIKNNADLTKTGINIVDLKQKITERVGVK